MYFFVTVYLCILLRIYVCFLCHKWQQGDNGKGLKNKFDILGNVRVLALFFCRKLDKNIDTTLRAVR